MTAAASPEPVRALRPAARLLVTDPAGRLLMFRFTPADRPPFWCTPGGALDPGESYAAAARRELLEETGIDADPGAEIAVRHVQFVTLLGVPVDAEERYYHVRAGRAAINTARHTDLERAVMLTHRWFTPDELVRLEEAWFPEDLAELWQQVLKAPA